MKSPSRALKACAGPAAVALIGSLTFSVTACGVLAKKSSSSPTPASPSASPSPDVQNTPAPAASTPPAALAATSPAPVSSTALSPSQGQASGTPALATSSASGTTTPTTPSLVPGTPEDLGFMTCVADSSGSYVNSCVLKDKDLAPIQTVFSSFVVTYSFPCTGPELALVLQTDKVKDVTLPNSRAGSAAPTRTETLYGFGPLQIAATSHNRLFAADIQPDCKLNIQSVQITPVP